MTLSEVFYEAACRMSDVEDSYGDASCLVVQRIQKKSLPTYQDLMSDECPYGCIHLCSDSVDQAARRVKWSQRDFRTFMLLMASEAVK